MILQPVFKRIAVLGLIVGLMFSGVLIAISQGAPLQDSATSSQAVLPVELKQQAPEELFPFWIPIPSADGSQIQLIALNVENQGDAVVESNYQPAITDEFDPSSYQWSHTGSYSSTIQGDGYISFATVPIGVNLVGDITMTVNSELVTNNMELNRYYISSSNQSPLEYDTKDGGFELSIPNEDTFATDEIYLTLMVNDFRPIDFLAESRPITKIYSVYSSSADLTTEKPILLQFNYNSILLGDADPFMLGVYRWSPNGDTWLEEDGTLFSDQSFFSLGTTQMGTFVVLVGPRWKDSFDDLKGISNDIDNVTLSRNGRLLLQPAETEGYAISRPITPTTLASWDTLTFDAIVEDEGTSVTVDILNAATGQTIMSDVTSGADISGIDPSANPAVQLRVSFTRSETSQTVALGNWQVSWTSSPDQLTPTPTEMITPTVLATPMPTVTITPTVSATPMPTVTITPTVSTTPTPTETPQPTVTPDPPVDSNILFTCLSF